MARSIVSLCTEHCIIAIVFAIVYDLISVSWIFTVFWICPFGFVCSTDCFSIFFLISCLFLCFFLCLLILLCLPLLIKLFSPHTDPTHPSLQDTSPPVDQADVTQLQTQLTQLQTNPSGLPGATNDPPDHQQSVLPNKLNGCVDSFKGFLQQCEVFFVHKPDTYCSNSTKCAFLLMLLTG